MGGKYGSYKRIHKAAHASDQEKGKISRETARARRAKRDAEALSSHVLANPEDDGAADELEELRLAAERESRNARGHKRRLKHLLKDKDFV
jgi:hypothetical protein